MYQQCIIMGNLGKDPVMRYTPSGKAVTDFTVAVNNRIQEEGEWKDKTIWFRVTCWDRLAETSNQYLKKGSKVFVVGRIDVSTWTDKQGETRATLELTAREVKFLSGREDGGEPGGAMSGGSPARDEEDIPF